MIKTRLFFYLMDINIELLYPKPLVLHINYPESVVLSILSKTEETLYFYICTETQEKKIKSVKISPNINKYLFLWTTQELSNFTTGEYILKIKIENWFGWKTKIIHEENISLI